VLVVERLLLEIILATLEARQALPVSLALLAVAAVLAPGLLHRMGYRVHVAVGLQTAVLLAHRLIQRWALLEVQVLLPQVLVAAGPVLWVLTMAGPSTQVALAVLDSQVQ
jgi:hypothetical protein